MFIPIFYSVFVYFIFEYKTDRSNKDKIYFKALDLSSINLYCSFLTSAVVTLLVHLKEFRFAALYFWEMRGSGLLQQQDTTLLQHNEFAPTGNCSV